MSLLEVEVLNKFEWGMSVSVIGHHCGVKKSMDAKFICVIIMVSSLTRWMGQYVYGWMVGHREGFQLCCGEGDNHVVIQLLHRGSV